MTNGTILLKWRDRNWAEHGHYIYRSVTPMDINNLPTPIATIDANEYEYIDYDVVAEQTYYYRIGAFRNSDVSVSDEIDVIATPSTLDIFDIFGDSSEIATIPMNGATEELSGRFTPTSMGDITFENAQSSRLAFKSDSNNSIVIPTTEATAISFWFKRDILVSDIGALIQFQNATGNSAVGFGKSSNDIGIVVNGTAGSSISIRNTFVVGTWHHVYADRSGRFIMDNVEYTTTLRSTPFYTNSSSEIIIGGRFINNTYVPDRSEALIAQVRIFNRQLTTDEVATLYSEYD